MKKLILPLVLLLLSTGLSAQNMLTLDHYQDYEWASNPRLSPDGNAVVYSRNWINLMDDTRESDLWLINADGSRHRFFAKGSGGSWSPQGDRILFTKKGEPAGTQMFIKYVGVEGEPTQITRLEKSPSSITWSPDGRYIAFLMTVDENNNWAIDIPSKPKGAKWTTPPKVVTKVNYRRDRVGFVEDGYRQIFVVPADGGAARQITTGSWNVSSRFSWAPDGKSIVFSSFREADAEYARGQSNLYTVQIADGTITQLTDRDGAESAPTISPDGKKVAYIGSIHTSNFYKKRRVFSVNIDGSGERLLTDDLDRSPSSIMWAEDNSGIYFNVDDRGTRNLQFVDTRGRIKPVTKGTHMLTVTELKGGKAVATRTSFHNPSDIALVDLGKGQVNQLTNINSDILDFVKLGDVEEIWYPSVGDLQIQGWIVKPPNFDPSKKYPLILRIHGGPHAMYNVGFNFNNQVHASDGYVLLYTNPRGSTGYGYDFANAIQNNYPGDDYHDLMNGVDELIKKGYIDESKLYVYGGSGGGVLTSWIVGHTDRFAAASVNYPVIDWLSFVGTTDGIGWYDNFEHKPWEDPSEHLKRSPLMYVGNVTTPTMLMTGVKDLRTPISQTEEFYQALKVERVPTVMVRFNEEFHGTSRKPSNFLRTMGYLKGWFGKYEKQDTSLDQEIKK